MKIKVKRYRRRDGTKVRASRRKRRRKIAAIGATSAVGFLIGARLLNKNKKPVVSKKDLSNRVKGFADLKKEFIEEEREYLSNTTPLKIGLGKKLSPSNKKFVKKFPELVDYTVKENEKSYSPTELEDRLEMFEKSNKFKRETRIFRSKSRASKLKKENKFRKCFLTLEFARPKGARDKKPRKRRGKAVFFEGRRTAILVRAGSRSEAISKARKLKRRGGDGVKEVRNLNTKEESQARTGKWLRIRPKGFTKDMRGFGPKPK